MAYKRSRQTFEADGRKQDSPFVVYGTPLPPLDDDMRDDGSYVPVWKQEVTDDRGRKRLHGAFTGGFSAGYFNTVGSKEGWTPSTFVSSRSNRAKDRKEAPQQKREDFMDEEDIREQEESRQLSTTDGFAGFGTEDDPMRKNTLMDLLRPAEDSIGVKLLNKMGWKQGQGIGPRVKRKVDPNGNGSEVHQFAPDDVSMIYFVKRNDAKGLGYNGEVAMSTTPSKSTLTVDKSLEHSDDDDESSRPGLSFMGRTQKRTMKNKKSAFGVGILNDTGSDEEDPYSMGPKILYNKAIGSDKAAKKKGASSFGAANPLVRNAPTFVSKKLSSIQNALRKCHDGRLPLTGFVLADELDSFSSMSLTGDKYKPPEVPSDWKPAKATPESAEDTSNDAKQGAGYRSTADIAKQSSHTSLTRGAMLGEQKLPGKSVFDFLTPEARAKLMQATGKTNLPPALSEQLAGSVTDTHGANSASSVDVPFLDPATAKSALSRADSGGFIPYAEDLEKRARYKHFLELAAGLYPEGTLPLKPPNMVGKEDWTNELYEFVRAAEVFRPMTGAIASRFTSSSSNLKTERGDQNGAAETDNLVRKPLTKPEDPAEVAAKLGMFGVMTRSVSSFQPTRMVCKRFGVEMPIYMPGMQETRSSTPYHPSETRTTAPMTDPKSAHAMEVDRFTPSASISTRSELTKSQDNDHGQGGSSTSIGEKPTSNNEVAPPSTAAAAMTTLTTVNPDHNEALEVTRPGQEVFRAIFGDSDSDSDD